jgi:hypothetical protein
MPTENDQPTTEEVTERTTTTKTTPPAKPAVDPPAQPFADLESANAEVKKLREESAGRRVANRDLQTQIADLQKQVPTADVQSQITELQGQLNRYQAAGEAGVSPELLRASDELRSATTADEMKAATEKITRLTAAQTTNGPRNPAPPKVPTTPPSLDEQITAAESGKNVREAMRLKTQKLTEQQ